MLGPSRYSIVGTGLNSHGDVLPRGQSETLERLHSTIDEHGNERTKQGATLVLSRFE